MSDRCSVTDRCDRPDWRIVGRSTDSDTVRREVWCFSCGGRFVDEVLGSQARADDEDRHHLPMTENAEPPEFTMATDGESV